MDDIISLIGGIAAIGALILMITSGAVSLGVFLAERRWKDKK